MCFIRKILQAVLSTTVLRASTGLSKKTGSHELGKVSLEACV